jgi:hypothetical protein
MLSVCTVCALIVASASAHSFIIEGKEIAAGEHIAAEGEAIGTSTFEARGFITECKKSTSVAEFEAGGKGKSTLTTKECKVRQDAGCKVEEPIVTKTKTELVIFNEKLAVKLLPASGEIFNTNTVRGCNRSELNGEWTLTGSQISELPEAEVEKVEHESVTKPSGSSLKISGRPGTFAGFVEGKSKTKLTSGKKWHVK